MEPTPAPASPPTSPYDMPLPPAKPGTSKKMMLLLFGGILVLLGLVAWLVFGGKAPAGREAMQTTVQNTADALAIIDEYQDQLQYADTKNKLALAQTLLRDSYQELNGVYEKTYKPKKKFSNSPQPDEKSKTTLDSAARNNQLDSTIIQVLKPKVTTATTSLKSAAPSFSQPATVEQLEQAYANLLSVEQLLNQPL